MKCLFEIWDGLGGNEIHIDSLLDMTKKLALLVISMAGFGRRIGWDPKDDKAPEGHQMSFSKTLWAVSKNLVLGILIPGWAKNLTKTARNITTAFSEFGAYLTDMVSSRKSSGSFSILLSANEENAQNGEKGLDDREVVGELMSRSTPML
ncbi:unnamed protein product [Rhizoctonia solani]|uniref:Uncharacterized protein n=1 Tax=Rhizoctonia solani TaxID=456999 RepID=A0A8H2Y4D9_9AGAM|nr:unnamed protein product [Rhizoctonia solani]